MESIETKDVDRNNALVSNTDNDLSRIQKVGLFIQKHSTWLAVALLGALMVGNMVFARISVTGGDAANTLWSSMMELIRVWVLRLGAVVVIVGAIMFGLGWKSEDAEQKSRGISTMVAGAVVMAVGGFMALIDW